MGNQHHGKQPTERVTGQQTHPSEKPMVRNYRCRSPGIGGTIREEIMGVKRGRGKTVINYRANNACGALPPMQFSS